MLKGTITKTFTLKNPEEELIISRSNNFILYKKKSLEIKSKLNLATCRSKFYGKGQVELICTEKGIIFDSEIKEVIQFTNDDRAEELILTL